MHEDYDQVPGWPAEQTRVYAATERIFPKPLFESERRKQLEEQERWRRNNTNRHRLNRRIYETDLRAQRAATKALLGSAA